MSRISQQTVKKLVTDKPVAKIVWDDELRGFGVLLTFFFIRRHDHVRS